MEVIQRSSRVRLGTVEVWYHERGRLRWTQEVEDSGAPSQKCPRDDCKRSELAFGSLFKAGEYWCASFEVLSGEAYEKRAILL
jgi:hypothetical protein